MTSNPPKVFCVGFNKTGTTTLHRLFADELGLRSAHNPRWTDWSITRDTSNLDRFDAFSDGGCPSVRDLDELYPDALFVLNTRPMRNWVLSRHKALMRSRAAVRWALTKYVPLGWLAAVINHRYLDDSERAMARWVAIRNAYHAHVLRYFQGRDGKLLVVDIESPEAPRRVAAFLGLATPEAAPHANADGKGSMTATILEAIGTRLDTAASAEATDAFFAARLPDHTDELTTFESDEFRLGRSASDRVARIAPFLRPVFRRIYRGAVSARSRSRSFLAKIWWDAFIRFCRSEQDLHEFTTVHRIGSASR